MPRNLINAAVSVLKVTAIASCLAATMALVSCGEKPPRADPEARKAYRNETPQNPAYERTLKQGESERMGD
jgi:hypothetical protein